MIRYSRLILLAELILLFCSQTQAAKKALTAEDVVSSGAFLSPAISEVRWRPGGQELSYIRRTEAGATALFAYEVATLREHEIARASGETKDLDLSSYQWSPDGKSLLLEGKDDLWLLDVASGQVRRLTNDAEAEQDATFSPVGNRIAFVKKNDLYTLDLKSSQIARLTSDGSELVLNGKLDWVYEEELANRATGQAYQWSPDGRKIAFLRLDDSAVPRYPLTHFLATHVTLDEERFPQPGDLNPAASLAVVEVGENGGVNRWGPIPLGTGLEYFGPALSWTPDSSTVSYLTLNRDQTEEPVRTLDLASGQSRLDSTLLVEKDPCWINSLEPPYFLKDGRFLWLSERAGWLHLYLYHRGGVVERQLTRGSWMIDHPVFSNVPMFQVDEASGWVYFQSTDPDPRERQVFRVRLEGGSPERLTKEPGNHSFSLSPDGRFMVDTFSSLNTPPATRLLKADGTLVATIDMPSNHLDEYSLPTHQLLEVKAADGATLYAALSKPPNFDPHKKYPAVVFVYGGPRVQLVENRWSEIGANDLLAAHGYLVWSLDNRGSWGRGHAWESVIFEHMGRQELDDQRAGIDYLKSMPYVDGTRLGIWGWSYGGYMTLYSLTHAPDVFKCGVAGGPVTDWKFYDSIYTERYMRTPAVNADGYRDSSPLEAASRLKARLLLIHGADDDNVHLQNTYNFVNALVDADIPFDLYVQPGQKHGFAGRQIRKYLDERILEYFEKNL